MSNIDAAHYEKVESASESIQPTGNDCLDVELDLARLAPHSKPRKFRKDDNLFETVPQCSPGFAPRTKSRNSVKDESPLLDALQWIFGHQIGILDCDTLSLLRCLIGLIAVSIILLMLLFWTHMCFPQTRTQTRKFFQLSYYNPDTGKYALGFNDASLVGYWVLVFTVLRAATMDYALMPLAKKAGVKTARDQVRFCEQAWLLVYYSFFWTLGMYIMINSDYWLNLKNMWTNFPNRETDGLLKWYTLTQYAFWVQQFIVLHIEKRRKDHWQMFAHHVVTTLLIFCSYCYHQTRVANLILCIMDVVDLFFPTAKCLKYAGYNTLCDVMFGVFMIVWIIARHIIFMMATYSVYAHSNTVSPPGCYRGKMGSITGPFPPPNRYGHLLEPFIDPEGLVCWTGQVRWGFVNSLLFLQVLTLIWFSMIVKVAVKVLRGGQADDTRSEDEAEEVDTELKKGKSVEATDPSDNGGELQPLEEEVGVASLNLRGRTSLASQKRYQKSASYASGASMAGKKQLLDRIGCEKKTSD